MDYSELAKSYGCIVIEVRDDPDDPLVKINGRSAYHNRSSAAGTEIWLGFYDNPEHRDISFWHEIGHHMVSKEMPENVHCMSWWVEKYPFLAELLKPDEPLAWKFGLEEAAKHDICFSAKAKEWALLQLETYMKDDGDRLNIYGPMTEKAREQVRVLSGLKEY